MSFDTREASQGLLDARPCTFQLHYDPIVAEAWSPLLERNESGIFHRKEVRLVLPAFR